MTAETNQIRDLFSQRLRELRKQAGYRSARSLAERLEIDENRYTRYERAEVEPNLQLFSRICEILRITPNDLLGYPPAALTTRPETYGAPQENMGASWSAAPGFSAPHTPYDYQSRQPDPELNDGARGRAADDRQQKLTSASWALARKLAELGERQSGKSGPPTLEEIAKASEFFNRISADPLGFAAQLVVEPSIQSAGQSDKEAVAHLLSEMTEIAVTV
ncbi:MAG: helix-turn-helix transcriptional regulator [Pseudomonadota bacterium]